MWLGFEIHSSEYRDFFWGFIIKEKKIPQWNSHFATAWYFCRECILLITKDVSLCVYIMERNMLFVVICPHDSPNIVLICTPPTPYFGSNAKYVYNKNYFLRRFMKMNEYPWAGFVFWCFCQMNVFYVFHHMIIDDVIFPDFFSF